MVIRVFFGMYMAVMFVVFAIQLLIPERRIQKRRKIANSVVDILVGRYRSVHSIVCRNEKAGVQVHLHQYEKI